MGRRKFIKKIAVATASAILASKSGLANSLLNEEKHILKVKPLGFPWATQDPFIFCAYHKDSYPIGDGNLGPKSSLEGRNIGQDFGGKDGWSMYHGTKVPGFPAHPHCGFETVSIVTQGMIDHSDSLGGQGRFGKGDVQWLTSGKGVQHAEMFPLLNDDKANPFEMFQLWLNLPKKSKKVDPHYKMLWKEDIPNIIIENSLGKMTSIDLIAGTIDDIKALASTPNSWAADPNNDLQIWTISMEPSAEFIIPISDFDVNRSLYFYSGNEIQIGDEIIKEKNIIDLNSKNEILVKNGNNNSSLLFLQGKPINEPLVQQGPFVANSREEINEAIQEYRKTEFGSWPWSSNGPVHNEVNGRFAKFSDGKMEKRE